MSPVTHMIFALLISCGAVACVSPRAQVTGEPVAGRDYQFTYSDAPDERQIRLTLTSNATRQICTSPSTWPSAIGRLHSASGRVYLKVQGRLFDYKDFDMGACMVKACGNPLGHGGTLKAFLLYSDFGLPADLDSQPKTLIFEPMPFWCDQGHWIDVRRPAQ